MIYHQNNLIYSFVGIKQEKNMPNEIHIELIFKNDGVEYPLSISIRNSTWAWAYLIDTTVPFDDIDVEIKYSLENEVINKICSLLHDKDAETFYQLLDRL